MQGDFDHFIPVAYSGGPPPPELQDESSLLFQLAVESLDPSVVRLHLWKKYLVYALILVFCIGLPLTVFGLVSLSEWGLPRWVSEIGIWLALAVFFVLFFVMIALIATRGKITRYLGFRPVTRLGKKAQGSPDADREYVVLEGERRGRLWEYGILGGENFWRCKEPAPPFQVAYLNGAFGTSPGTPAGLPSLLAKVPPHRRWRGLRIVGGPEGIRSSRPAPLAKYFLQDLWLMEKIAEALRR